MHVSAGLEYHRCVCLRIDHGIRIARPDVLTWPSYKHIAGRDWRYLAGKENCFQQSYRSIGYAR